MTTALFAILTWSAIAAALDLAKDRIPNSFIFFGFVLAGGCLFFREEKAFLSGIGAAFLLFLLLFPLYSLGALGAGDVKLFCVMGVYLGLSECFLLLQSAFFFGAIPAFFHVIRNRRLSGRIHFALPLLAGFTFTILEKQ